MTSKPTVNSDPAPILACTISRDVQRFDLLIDDMEQELGEAWGDLNFEDALVFLKQPDSTGMPFNQVGAVDHCTRVARLLQPARHSAVMTKCHADGLNVTLMA